MGENSIWQAMRKQALELASQDPLLASYFHESISQHDRFDLALAYQVSSMLSSDVVPAIALFELFSDCVDQDESIALSAIADIEACYDRDPACSNYCQPFLYFKGFLSLQAYRFAHHLWVRQRHCLARYLGMQASKVFDVDIHPAAVLGKGIMLDHATGIVIGETAKIGDNVSLLHGVTLGGSGNQSGQRHPTVENGVMISCGSKVLGNVRLGNGVKVGGGSLVLTDVDDHMTVVGVPARVVGKAGHDAPALFMDQDFSN